MCVRIIEIVMIIIIFIKKCFPVSCNGTQEIIYLEEVACMHYYYDNYSHHRNVTVHCNNFTGMQTTIFSIN